MTEMTLKGDPTGDRNSHRVSYLTTAVNNAETKVNHLDNMRQKNFTIALVIFAGLFGFALKTVQTFSPLLTAGALLLLMLLFTTLDRRLHRMSHGWQETRKIFMFRLTDVINNPQDDVTFVRYYSEAERKAQWFSLLPVLYYVLVVGSVLSGAILFLIAGGQPGTDGV